MLTAQISKHQHLLKYPSLTPPYLTHILLTTTTTTTTTKAHQNIMNFSKAPKATLILLLTILLITLAHATRPDPKETKPKGPNRNGNNNYGFSGPGGGFFGPGSGFNIPGFDQGWVPGVTSGGYGYGYGSPSGGHSKGGIIRPTVVCKEQGPCYMKKLRCPAKCFSSYSSSGKGYGGGGGGGGCTMDCEKTCTAYC